jgi:hypothetical protein
MKYLTRGILYKFTLQKCPKINKVWESYNNFHLEHKIFVRHLALKRGYIKLLQAKIPYLEGIIFYKYIRWMACQEDKLKIKGLKGMQLTIGINVYWKIYFG